MKNLLRCQKCHSTSNLYLQHTSSSGKKQYLCQKCNTERHREYRKTKNGKKRVYDAVYKSIKKYPERQKARLSVYFAIQNGSLIKPEICEKCGSKKTLFGHHSDYKKPLDVEWICRECHAQIHKAI